MNKEQERRGNYPMPEEEMYKLSNIQEFIEKERRHDEKTRLTEVQQQKRVWLYTLIFCGLLNLILLFFGLTGGRF